MLPPIRGFWILYFSTPCLFISLTGDVVTVNGYPFTLILPSVGVTVAENHVDLMTLLHEFSPYRHLLPYVAPERIGQQQNS